MRVVVEDVAALLFDDGLPVRAASAVAPFGDGWLIVQDDSAHAAWWRPGSVTPIRVVDATDRLKPDFQAACAVPVHGRHGVLLLGSGSAAARRRASLVTFTAAEPAFAVTALDPVYHKVAAALGRRGDQLNLAGACLIGDRLRWFQRGDAAAGGPTASVDVDLAALLGAVTGAGDAGQVEIIDVRRYDLGVVGGAVPAVTCAVALADGRVLVSAAAQDGPAVVAALALLDDDGVVDVATLPDTGGLAGKVDGLAVREVTGDGLRILAVADAGHPLVAAHQLALRLHW